MNVDFRIPFPRISQEGVESPEDEWISGTIHYPVGTSPGQGSESKPTSILILCHGIAAHRNSPKLYPLVAERLSFPTLRFDFRGCGMSSGSVLRMVDYFRCVDDLALVLDWLRKQGGWKVEGVVGHSMGSMFPLASPRLISLSGRFAMKQGLTEKVVRDGVVPKEQMHSILAAKQLNERRDEFTVKGWRSGRVDESGNVVRGSVVEYSLCIQEAIALWERIDSLLPSLKELPSHIQSLIIHGDEDEIVPAKDALLFEKVLPNNSLHLIVKGNHNLTGKEDGDEGRLHIDVVANIIVEWVHKLGTFLTISQSYELILIMQFL
ncbi:alpha/beta-hydrolase [Rhizoclosmatium globosum]|uniref:Alpha/beta-hydrolase n=1 Tax=Rhizoclosmatium globosum TaxID=329046 RepID=A0A1Y2BZC7_9FUNG|nr:alpha/beta-hydrolase [Rhizoclosmatium globosum]|eukprot:ORY40132.1 alpha/beta-hydrolase [Rhizoclosmatium globosum]